MTAASSAALVLALAVVTCLLVVYPGTDDLNSYFLPWVHNIRQLGLTAGFAASRGDYPPGTSLLFVAAVRLGDWLHVDERLAIRWSQALALVVSSGMVGVWTRSAWAAIAFHLAMLMPIVCLGYVDAYFFPWLIGALWALDRRRLALAGALFAGACVIKWQPIIVLPFVLVYCWRVGALRLKGLSWFLAAAAAVAVVVVAPFGTAVGDAWHAATHHRFLSGNALNFSWLVTHWLHVYRPARFGALIDGQSTFVETTSAAYTTLPHILFYLTYGAAVLAAVRWTTSFCSLLRFSVVGSLAYFTFNTGVHENHLIVPVCLLVLLAAHERENWLAAIAVAVFSDLNLYLFYGVDGLGFHYSRVVFGLDAALVLAATMVVYFSVLGISLGQRARALAS